LACVPESPQKTEANPAEFDKQKRELTEQVLNESVDWLMKPFRSSLEER